MLAAAGAAMPELPAARAERFERELGLTADGARRLAFRGELGDFFEAGLPHTDHAQQLAIWVTGELVRHLGDADPASSPLTPEGLAALVELVAAGKITQTAAKDVLAELVATGGSPEDVIAARGLGAIDDSDQLAGHRRGGRRRQPGRGREDPRRQPQGDRGDHRPGHAGDARAGPTAARSPGSCSPNSASTPEHARSYPGRPPGVQPRIIRTVIAGPASGVPSEVGGSPPAKSSNRGGRRRVTARSHGSDRPHHAGRMDR